MLSGEGKENGQITTIGLSNYPRSNFARAAHFFYTFLYRCLALLQRKTCRNVLLTRFMKEMSFFHCRSFSPWWPLSFLIFSPPATKFSCCSSNRKCLLCFLSLAVALCRSFSRWASLGCRLLALFLYLSISLYSKLVDMTIKSRLNMLDNTAIQKQFPLSVFVFIDSLVVSAS